MTCVGILIKEVRLWWTHQCCFCVSDLVLKTEILYSSQKPSLLPISLSWNVLKVLEVLQLTENFTCGQIIDVDDPFFCLSFADYWVAKTELCTTVVAGERSAQVVLQFPMQVVMTFWSRSGICKVWHYLRIITIMAPSEIFWFSVTSQSKHVWICGVPPMIRPYR